MHTSSNQCRRRVEMSSFVELENDKWQFALQNRALIESRFKIQYFNLQIFLSLISKIIIIAVNTTIHVCDCLCNIAFWSSLRNWDSIFAIYNSRLRFNWFCSTLEVDVISNNEKLESVTLNISNVSWSSIFHSLIKKRFAIHNFSADHIKRF